ncbi:MAG: prepilin-type N-terminal cleavage/methylation domain-containing protein [Gemmatimonadota bacterium]|nr:prepilin-type N-terminal cleavage/methylation domain-containing protein [Gemmatimonadota bacterium]
MRVLNLNVQKASPTRAPTRARIGFTLIELLVAMVIFGIVAGAVVNVMIASNRSTSDQAQRIDMQQNIRAANAILPAEIRQLDAADGDIKAMSANSVTIRANRQLGIICTAPVTGGALVGGVLNAAAVVVRSPLYSAQRAFAANDSIWVWYEGNVGSRTDDGWLPGLVTAVAAQNCADGTAGIRLIANLNLTGRVNAANVVPTGSPVFGFEPVTYATGLAADGRYYLNMTTPAGTAPVLGPLPDVNGVSFTYYDANGAVTANPLLVRQIGLSVREQSVNRIRKGTTTAYAVDSLLTRITLRNNPRF